MTRPAPAHLSLSMIQSSLEIQAWLSQFAECDRPTAIAMLLRLNFYSRDTYSQWVLQKLAAFSPRKKWAVYSVRKFARTTSSIWRRTGGSLSRPTTSLGSEDFVVSLIANAIDNAGDHLVDHPSIAVLRKHKIHDVVLVDDSIGSGKRVSDFIRLMTNHNTFRSWWSYGFITLYIIALGSTRDARDRILRETVGSDHGNGKRRLSDKLRFSSDIVYSVDNLRWRWGGHWREVVALCDSLTAIPKNSRRGFGGVMGNIIFHHSVPNNIPGMYYKATKGWQPLFPKRVMPYWLHALLASGDRPTSSDIVSADMAAFLAIVKGGLHRADSIAFRMDRDIVHVKELAKQAIAAGFTSAKHRLTAVGRNVFMRNAKKPGRPIEMGRPLYIPDKWCTDQMDVQPSGLATPGQTDSVRRSAADGEVR